MTRFTDEQTAAIERRTGSLLVSAAAGSGKTSVLVERFVRSVIEDGVAPNAILAITFTEKAAGELRARVRRRFVELGERRHAQEAEGAWISTIHGFCARVLGAHAAQAGLDPRFGVLDEATARELRNAAFERALAGFLDDRADAVGGGADAPEVDPRAHAAAALDLVAAYRPDRLSAMVFGAHEALRSDGREPRLPVRAPREYPAAERAALTATAAAALTELGASAGKTVDRARERILACADLVERLGPEEEPGARLAAGAFAKGRTGALQGPAVEEYLRAHGAFAKACADRAARPALVLIDELLGRFAAAYAEAKRERAALDYDDLELLTRDLFAGSPAVAAGYAERFERVMVDEFQDTNRLQLELLAFLDRDDVFLVGDDRQSIYGFRHASVAVFRERRAAMAERGAAVRLATNFRSLPEVLAPINRVAVEPPGAKTALVAEPPADDDGDPLVPAREPAGGDARVELHLLDRDFAWPEDDSLPASQPWRRAEARMVARRVADLVAAGEHPAGEIVVLLRAAGDMATYERALEDAGLATLASGGRGFWARQQVQDLCSYLAALVNPRDEEALLGVLASPLGAAASPDALALLALAAREPRRALWDVLRGDAAVRGEAAPRELPAWSAPLPTAERERIAAFAEAFAAERLRAPRLGLDALLERAIARTRYDEHVLRLPGGVRRLANVTKLVRLAAEFEAERGRDVRALVDRALGELEADAREPDAPVELAGLDAVRLMTIHAAKGLEFPVVVLADLGRPPNSQTPDLLVDGDRVGLRLVPMHGESAPALDYDDLRDEALDRDAAEERRVFHVAMTRAEERLIVAGSVAIEKWPELRRGCPPIVWLATELVPTLRDRLAAGETHVTDSGVRVAVHRPEAEMRLFEPEPQHLAAPGEGAALAGSAAAEGAALAGSGAGGAALAGSGAAGGAALAGSSTHEIAPLSAVAPGAPPVATVSYTSLSRYAQCPYRFYLERILRLPTQEPPPAPGEEAVPEATEGIDPLQRGSLAHELLEALDLADPRPPTAEEVRALAGLDDLELTDAEIADLRALVEAAIGTSTLQRIRHATRIHREQPFTLTLTSDHHAKPLLNGVVDLLAIEPDGGALVVDYKTDRLDGADPEEVVAHGYAIQRAIYALAALRSGAPRVEVAHLFLERPEEPAVARFAAADAPDLERQVLRRAEGLLAGDFPVAPRPHYDLCANCPGRGGLCSWPEELTLRPAAEALAEPEPES